MSEFGELIAEGTVRFERRLPGSIERVWSYLVEPEKRAQWLAGGIMESEVGGRVELHFHNNSLSDLPDCEPPDSCKDMPEKVVSTGKVTVFEPPQRLSFVWYGHDATVDAEATDAEATEVSFELKSTDEGVLLAVTHRRLPDRDMMMGACGGWHTHLDILVAVLNEETVPPFWKSHIGFVAEYEKRLPV